MFSLLLCGVGYDSADTQVHFMHNDGTGAATKIPIGVNFPKPTTDLTNMLQDVSDKYNKTT